MAVKGDMAPSFSDRRRPNVAASWVALVVFVAAGGGVWSNWYPEERMPALWLKQQVSEGVRWFEWYYSEAGAVLCGTSIADTRLASTDWQQTARTVAGVVAALSGVSFIRTGLQVQLGGCIVWGLVCIVSLAALQRGRLQRRRPDTTESEPTGRRTRG